jgi:hypothetical protein
MISRRLVVGPWLHAYHNTVAGIKAFSRYRQCTKIFKSAYIYVLQRLLNNMDTLMTNHVHLCCSCIQLVDVYGDGDHKLLVADADRRLKMYKGTLVMICIHALKHHEYRSINMSEYILDI